MKKIQALALLPIIALASCGKNEEVTVETQKETTPVATTEVTSTPTEVTSQETPVEDEGTGETLNSGITAIPVATEQPYEFTYKLGDQIIPVKWVFSIADWKVASMSIDGFKPGDKWPFAEFAKNVPFAVIGKELKGLKIDSISWASLTSAGFNEYLATLK